MYIYIYSLVFCGVVFFFNLFLRENVIMFLLLYCFLYYMSFLVCIGKVIILFCTIWTSYCSVDFPCFCVCHVFGDVFCVVCVARYFSIHKCIQKSIFYCLWKCNRVFVCCILKLFCVFFSKLDNVNVGSFAS